jgi:hypothetical protein
MINEDWLQEDGIKVHASQILLELDGNDAVLAYSI